MMADRLASRWQMVGWFCCLLALSGCSQQATTSTPLPGANTVAAQGRQLSTRPFEFATPFRLSTAKGPVRVDIPGYAAPCWADVDADGNQDLLVGQFNGGKIRVYKNLGNLQLAEGEWLQASGQVAKVPGVW